MSDAAMKKAKRKKVVKMKPFELWCIVDCIDGTVLGTRMYKSAECDGLSRHIRLVGPFTINESGRELPRKGRK